MKYDDASWHYGGEFPADSPDEFGGTHIGLLLKWCLLKGWAGEELLDDCAEDLERLIAGELTGTAFLFQNCDGKFSDVDLSEGGNDFLRGYYGENGPYLADYVAEFGDLMYVAGEQAHDFDKFSQMVDARYETWLQHAAGS